MKYKVNDVVKIVACNHGHKFEIDEAVTIIEIHNQHYHATDGKKQWSIEDDEIAPISESTIITRPHDYTGCDPEIAEALKQSLDVYCEVWDDEEPENIYKEWIIGYQRSVDYPYESMLTVYDHARPICQEPTQKPKTKLVPKPASEIFAWLENPENGYYLDSDGDYSTYDDAPSFVTSMLKHCGTDDCGGWSWRPEWLREVPIEEEISEASENAPQTATILEHTTAHLRPGNEVTIIRQHEDGDYLCEFHTGIRIWMQPYQLKFD